MLTNGILVFVCVALMVLIVKTISSLWESNSF